MNRFVYILLVFALPQISLTSQGNSVVDSIYARMSLEERVGQLFMIRAHSDLGEDHIIDVRRQIQKYHIGSMCFFQGTPEGHAKLINHYQVLSKLPLLIAMDAEWGGGMRFKSASMNFPRQLTLGAIQGNGLIYDMGLEVGHQLRDIGIHVNFAPVADVNNNSANPVINDRSFGEDRFNVTAKTYQYMRGMQDAGIMACAKHFPGHGDTDVDSHVDLPVIKHDRRRLDSIELYPFRTLIDKGVGSVMVAHLNVPALDATDKLPTTLSKKVVTGVLRNELGFDGLVFTDALEMKGVTKHYPPGVAEVMSLQAGNDVLCLPANIDVAFPAVVEAVKSGSLDEVRLEESVKRILDAKLELGLFDNTRANESPDPFPAKGLALKEELIEQSITAVSNEDGLLPIEELTSQTFASLVVGKTGDNVFQSRLSSYVDVKSIAVSTSDLERRSGPLVDLLKSNDVVIAGIMGMNKYESKSFGLSESEIELLHRLDDSTNLVVVVFGSPYALGLLEGLSNVIVAYQDDPITQDIAAQAVFGAISMTGRLPVSASKVYEVNHGIMIPSLGRLGYSTPHRMGMSVDSLMRIEEIVDEMIDEHAAPGCQVLVAKGGKVVYSKSFGHFTYENKRPVTNTDIYDVASVTKVAATTLAAMSLHEEGRFLPKQTLHFYLDDVENTNKEYLVVRDIMAHQAGLQPWIPFYASTLENVGSSTVPSPELYSSKREADYSIEVAKGLYLKESHVDSIWQRILDSKLRSNRRYRYSDIGFYLIAEIIQRQAESSLDTYCSRTFYDPLGVRRTLFRPLQKFDVSNIAPTEEDKSFRKQRLQGFVHDSGSAMLGGVGGHAGLFSNAEGLAVIFQMLLNGGEYGGKEYLEKSTIDKFTTRVPGSKRRALGFDMKNLETDASLAMAAEASENTYGHTGFTGTCVWADPDEDLIFVFLSNRTFPSARSNKLNKLEIRERIHSVVYSSIRP